MFRMMSSGELLAVGNWQLNYREWQRVFLRPLPLTAPELG